MQLNNSKWVRMLAGTIFGLLGVIQLFITRRYLWADVVFLLVAVGAFSGVLPVTKYFKKPALIAMSHLAMTANLIRDGTDQGRKRWTVTR
jgi:hypothetical protein